MEYYVHKEDCSIVRNHMAFTGFVVVLDCDGTKVLTLPEALGWTDDQIWFVIDTMNWVYNMGAYTGKQQKIREIKEVLDIVV